MHLSVLVVSKAAAFSMSHFKSYLYFAPEVYTLGKLYSTPTPNDRQLLGWS